LSKIIFVQRVTGIYEKLLSGSYAGITV
jgi:hypothetical protein